MEGRYQWCALSSVSNIHTAKISDYINSSFSCDNVGVANLHGEGARLCWFVEYCVSGMADSNDFARIASGGDKAFPNAASEKTAKRCIESSGII